MRPKYISELYIIKEPNKINYKQLKFKKMEEFILIFANRATSTQSWLVDNGDNFKLDPNYVRRVRIEIAHNYTYQIVVATERRFSFVTLKYNAENTEWSIHSTGPDAWRLVQEDQTITLSCVIEDAGCDAHAPFYSSEITNPKFEEHIEFRYPAYQHYLDNRDDTYCSNEKVDSRADGKVWIDLCLKAHPQSQTIKKQWISNEIVEKSIVWPC